MRNIYGIVAGTIIGALLGFLADQMITTYALRYATQPPVFIITNALSAFLVLPLIVVLCGYAGYRLVKKSDSSLTSAGKK